MAIIFHEYAMIIETIVSFPSINDRGPTVTTIVLAGTEIKM